MVQHKAMQAETVDFDSLELFLPNDCVGSARIVRHTQQLVHIERSFEVSSSRRHPRCCRDNLVSQNQRSAHVCGNGRMSRTHSDDPKYDNRVVHVGWRYR